MPRNPARGGITFRIDVLAVLGRLTRTSCTKNKMAGRNSRTGCNRPFFPKLITKTTSSQKQAKAGFYQDNVTSETLPASDWCLAWIRNMDHWAPL